MGRQLGAFDDSDAVDLPDMNKCPNCGSFFQTDKCPICGAECPENMKAGNRKREKHPKKRRRTNSGRYIEWYYRWWFIIPMLIMFPLIGIILLIKSDNTRGVKIGIVSAALVYFFVFQTGIAYNIIDSVFFAEKPQVNTSLGESEYKERCEAVDAENVYRNPAAYKGAFVRMKVKITGSVDNVYDYDSDYRLYYRCSAEVDGKSFEFFLRDYRRGDSPALIIDDIVTVFGEVGDRATVSYGYDYPDVTLPCINSAYFELE